MKNRRQREFDTRESFVTFSNRRDKVYNSSAIFIPRRPGNIIFRRKLKLRAYPPPSLHRDIHNATSDKRLRQMEQYR